MRPLTNQNGGLCRRNKTRSKRISSLNCLVARMSLCHHRQCVSTEFRPDLPLLTSSPLFCVNSGAQGPTKCGIFDHFDFHNFLLNCNTVSRFRSKGKEDSLFILSPNGLLCVRFSEPEKFSIQVLHDYGQFCRLDPSVWSEKS